MKRNTIKWRIFKYNLIIIIMLIALTTIIFNIAVHMYIQKELLGQLNKIAVNTENTALQHGPDFLPNPKDSPPPDDKKGYDLQGYYFMLDNSLRGTLTVLNADYILLDKDKKRITPFPERPSSLSPDFLNKLTNKINQSKSTKEKVVFKFKNSGTDYITIIKPVYNKNSFGLGWIIIYSSIEKINQLQIVINLILFSILVFSSIFTIIFSSRVSKKISKSISYLNQYIKSIAERNFGSKINMQVYDELQDFVNNINLMSEKLETYDKAQKTFLQNVSHEFRTPLMSIESYAEGIKYKVVDSNTATEIIIDETNRLTHLVEDLLYLSRLDAIEENYHFSIIDFQELLFSCVERLSTIARKNNKEIKLNTLDEIIEVYADEEKLSRAINNIINNCIRYAENKIIISAEILYNSRILLTISDDGPGFANEELPNIFERFYKGKKGNHGLGLSISKNIIEKSKGKIFAKNSDEGAIFFIELPIIKQK